MPVPGWINVLNPSPGEFLRFPSGRDPKITNFSVDVSSRRGFEVFPGYWRMGFGRDRVNGHLARMFFEPHYYCNILDVNIVEWRRLKSRPFFYVGERLKSASVDGSIYWLDVDSHGKSEKILALDLHNEEFRSLRSPPRFCKSGQIANLGDRLVVAGKDLREPRFMFCVLSMDPKDETWSITYSFPFPSSSTVSCVHWWWWHWCMPLVVSRRGDLYFYDQDNKLHVYCSDTGLVRGITCGGGGGIRIVAPFVENLLPIRCSSASSSGIRTFRFRPETCTCCFRQIKSSVSNVLRKEWIGITTTVVAVVALVVFLK